MLSCRLLLTLSFLILSNSSVIVKHPSELANQFDEPLKFTYANFGSVPYGYKTRAQIFYDFENTGQDYACSTLFDYEFQSNYLPSKLVSAIMIDRGSCNFVKKARNVQEAGGYLALIVNNNNEKKVEDIQMSDDGTGKDVFIPVVMIGKDDGDKIKAYLEKNKSEKVIIEFDFELAHQTEVVKVDFFYSTDSLEFYNAISSLCFYYYDLLSKIKFEPHIMTFDLGINSKEEVPNCFGKGKYCSHPRADLANIDGKDFISEGLRQKCISSQSSWSNDGRSFFFDYLRVFTDKCINGDVTEVNSDCSREAMAQVGIDIQNVANCLADEISLISKDKAVSMILEDRKLANEMDVYINPTLLINGKTYKGALTGWNVVEAICSAMKTKPELCFTLGMFNEENGISFWGVFFLIVLIVVLNIGIFFVCRRVMMRQIAENINDVDVSHKINSLVTNYSSFPK